MNPTFHTRFAPTPSGLLHVGNAVSFIITWALAKAHNGKIMLRIDDLDADRMRHEYVEDIFKTLDWLHLDYDSGPNSPDDFYKNYSQHHRLDLYFDALKELLKTGLLYECHCSRKDIRLNSLNGIYPNTCRKNILTPSSQHEKETSWRIIVPDNTEITHREWLKNDLPSLNLESEMGDFVILQKNGLPAYQLASLIDDTYFNINFIVRGKDLETSTAAQVYLAQVLKNDFPSLTTFLHHPLALNTEGVKLSKSKGAEALAEWRKQSIPPTLLFKMAADWLDIAHTEEIISSKDLVRLLKIKI